MTSVTSIDVEKSGYSERAGKHRRIALQLDEKRSGRLFIAACVMALSACAPATVKKLEATGVHTHAHVDRSYQVVYRQMYRKMRECMRGGWLSGPSFRVEGQLYDDIREGDITLVINGGHGGAEDGYAAHAVVKDAGGGTDIDLATSTLGMWKSKGPKMMRWATDPQSTCQD